MCRHGRYLRSNELAESQREKSPKGFDMRRLHHTMGARFLPAGSGAPRLRSGRVPLARAASGVQNFAPPLQGPACDLR
jgi:hypothetical protein